MSEKLDNLQLQLDEFEFLKSMYPGEGEVLCEDLLRFAEMRSFVDSGGKTKLSFERITFKIQLNTEAGVLIILAHLPHRYPSDQLPEVFIRSNDLKRNEEQKLNEEFMSFVNDELEVGNLNLGQICQWASETGGEFLSRCVRERSASNRDETHTQQQERKADAFSRFWIFSHHIYSKEKRKLILEWSRELKLSGFSLPGKPGVVCAEGETDNCEEYWRRLRNLNWKRIQLIDRYDRQLAEEEGETVDRHRRFEVGRFNEIDFAVHGGRDYHMDLGMFFDFLRERDLHAVFPLLFGVAGKSSSASTKT